MNRVIKYYLQRLLFLIFVLFDEEVELRRKKTKTKHCRLRGVLGKQKYMVVNINNQLACGRFVSSVSVAAFTTMHFSNQQHGMGLGSM